jgi:hypothetical protein
VTTTFQASSRRRFGELVCIVCDRDLRLGKRTAEPIMHQEKVGRTIFNQQQIHSPLLAGYTSIGARCEPRRGFTTELGGQSLCREALLVL